jgi:hypothetical protein
MGPHEPLRVVGGVDHAVDQVVRRQKFQARHPKIKIESPRQTGTGQWRATWPDEFGVTVIVLHTDSRHLLDYLEARFC